MTPKPFLTLIYTSSVKSQLWLIRQCIQVVHELISMYRCDLPTWIQLAIATEDLQLLATSETKSVKRCMSNCGHKNLWFTVHVQLLLTLHTTTNSVIVVVRFTLFTFAVARSSKSSVLLFYVHDLSIIVATN